MHGATTWRAAEARLLAARIESLVASDPSLGYGDVAMLMRAATDMPLYERALTERGIPTYAAGSRGYFSQQQIGDLRAYLRSACEPTRRRRPLLAAGITARRHLPRRPDAIAPAGTRGAARSLVVARAHVPRDPPTSDPATPPFPEPRSLSPPRLRPKICRRTPRRPRLSLETVIDRAVTWTGYDRVRPRHARRRAAHGPTSAS